MDVKVLSPVAVKPLLAKIGAELEQSGSRLVIQWGESATIKADIQNGAAFDVAVLTAQFVDDLIGAGKLDANTRTPIARSGIGVAVRKGAAKPDVGSVEAFKQALAAATSIGIVDHSASSRYLTGLFAKLGIDQEVNPKVKWLPGPAAPFVAKGDPQIAITQVSAILSFDGVELAGALPEEIQLFTTFAAGASPKATSDAVKQVMTSLNAPENAALLRGIGLEPL